MQTRELLAVVRSSECCCLCCQSGACSELLATESAVVHRRQMQIRRKMRYPTLQAARSAASHVCRNTGLEVTLRMIPQPKDATPLTLQLGPLRLAHARTIRFSGGSYSFSTKLISSKELPQSVKFSKLSAMCRSPLSQCEQCTEANHRTMSSATKYLKMMNLSHMGNLPLHIKVSGYIQAPHYNKKPETSESEMAIIPLRRRTNRPFNRIRTRLHI